MTVVDSLTRWSCRLSMIVVLLTLGTNTLDAQAPNERWLTIATEHFRVHFTASVEQLARRTSANAERAYEQLSAELPAPRGLVDVVVTDNVDYSNGSATPFPSNRIVIHAQPPVDATSLRFYDDWSTLVVTHELVHIFHLDRTRGWWRAAQYVFGRSPFLFPNQYLPAWAIEGIAVYYESKLTGSGRVAGTQHRTIARASALDGEFPRLADLSLATPHFPGGEEAYAMGGLFIDHLASTRGAESIPQYIEAVAGDPIPFLLDHDARRGFGVSFRRAWRGWRDSIEAGLVPGLGDDASAPFRSLTDGLWQTRAPRWRDASTLVVGLNDGRETAGAYSLSMNGELTRLGRRNDGSSQVPLADGGLLYAQLDYLDPWHLRSDLYISHGRRERRLTTGARLFRPDARADGAIVAVQSVAATTRLVRVSADGASIAPITSTDGDVQWTEPRWSPDGARIAAVRLAAGGRGDVVVLDSLGQLEVIAASSRSVQSAPSWAPDGRSLYYMSDSSGRAELYRAVIPANAGIHVPDRTMDSGFRRNDGVTVIPARAGTVIPARAGTVIPARAGTVIPARAGTVIPAKAGTVIPARAGTVIPAKAGTVIPAKAGTVIPARAGTVIPARAGAVIPANDTPVIPARAGTVIPAKAGTVIPAKAGIHVPDRTMDSGVRRNDGGVVANDALAATATGRGARLSGPIVVTSVERLTATATGLFDPTPSPDDRRLAAVRYEADGWTVVVAPLDTSATVAGTEGRGDDAWRARYASVVPLPEMEPVTTPAHPYSPWRTLVPRYWVPLLSIGDLDETFVGASTSASDVVGKHGYTAEAFVGTGTGLFEGTATYRYAGLGRPLLDLAIAQDWQRLTLRRRDGSVAGERRRRTRSLRSAAVFQRPRVRTNAWASVGAELEQRAYSTDPEPLLAQLGEFYQESRMVPAAQLSAGFSNTQRPTLSISPEDGIALSGTVRQRWLDGDVAPTTRSVVGALSGYKSLPWLPGFAHHVLAARVAGGWADDAATNEFQAGGVSGGVVELFPGVVVGEGQRTFGVRGVPAASLYGTRAVAGSVEYRAPLAAPGRGVAPLPVFIDRASLVLFADAATAWCPPSAAGRAACLGAPNESRWLSSFGAELDVDIALQYDVGYRGRLGVALPRPDDAVGLSGGVRVFVAVGRSF